METDENKEEELDGENILNKEINNKIGNIDEVPTDKKEPIKDTKEKMSQ